MKVIRGTYDEYVKFNGDKYADCPLAITIKDGECDYFIVCKGGKPFSDIVVFPKENNLININIILNFKDILKCLLKELKKDYQYLTFAGDDNNYKSLELIRQNCDCRKEYREKVQGNYEMTYIEVEL